MNILDIRSPYRELAIKRVLESHRWTETHINSRFVDLNDIDWKYTPEGYDFWNNVNNGHSPELPTPNNLEEIMENITAAIDSELYVDYQDYGYTDVGGQGDLIYKIEEILKKYMK